MITLLPWSHSFSDALLSMHPCLHTPNLAFGTFHDVPPILLSSLHLHLNTVSCSPFLEPSAHLLLPSFACAAPSLPRSPSFPLPFPSPSFQSSCFYKRPRMIWSSGFPAPRLAPLCSVLYSDTSKTQRIKSAPCVRLLSL